MSAPTQTCKGCRCCLTDGFCARVLAAEGPLTVAEVAERLGISPAYVRQIERCALRKLHRLLPLFLAEEKGARRDR